MIIAHDVEIKNSNQVITQSTAFPVNSLIKAIASLIASATQKRKQKLHSQMSKKEMQKFIEKKEAQGQKVDMNEINYNDYDEYNDYTQTI